MKKYKFWLILLFWLFWFTSFCSAIEILDNFNVWLSSSSTARSLSSISSNWLYYNYYRLNASIASYDIWYIMNASFWSTSSSNALYWDVINAFYCPYGQTVNETTVQNMFNWSNCEFIGSWVIWEFSSKYFINDTPRYSIIFITDWYSTSNWTVSSVYVWSNSYWKYELWNNYIKSREWYIKNSDCPSQYTSLECQSEYSLIPISSVDENYCLDNNLCSSSTWNVSRSALYINNIQHLSSPIISVDIPDEISWDYSVENDRFNLNIEGYNVDSDYIDWIINLQKSTPNNQDFNNIITNIIPLLVPGLVIILFIIFIFRFIKKIF